MEVQKIQNMTINFKFETTTNNKTVMSFYGGYAGNGLRVGAEFDTHTDDGSDITKQIIAGYASYKLSDNLEGLVYFEFEKLLFKKL